MIKKTEYSEIDDIKNDLNSLKDNVVELTKHVQENGSLQAQEFSEAARKQVKRFLTSGKQQIQKFERQVKDKPVQTVAAAFALGLLASALLSRRG